MEDLLVLGIIPGTSIQIDFYLWIQIFTVLAGLILFAVLRKVSNARRYINTLADSPNTTTGVFVSDTISAQ